MHDAYSALREPDFRRFVTMRFCMVLASAVQSVCTMWWVYELTKSPLMLGLTGLFEAVPAILLSLYGGHLADKLNRRAIVQACLVFSFFTWVFLASLPFLQNQFSVNALIGGIYAVSVMVGVMRAFYSPAAFSLLGQLVSKENFSNAITWNSSAWQVANLGGLAIGGFLFGWLGVKAVFILVVAISGIGVLSFLGIKSRPIPPATIANEPALVRIREGLSFVFKNQVLIAAIALDMFAVLFGGAVSILPIFSGEILHVGPTGLGFLRGRAQFRDVVGNFLARVDGGEVRLAHPGRGQLDKDASAVTGVARVKRRELRAHGQRGAIDLGDMRSGDEPVERILPFAVGDDVAAVLYI